MNKGWFVKMGKSKFLWNEFGKLKNNDDLREYMYNREFEHTNYYHYTSLENINSILKNKHFWLSCVAGFNDEIDKKQFGDENAQKEFYSLCFSTGVNENLPLWYLYSGIQGKGGRISFTKATIRDLINNVAVYKLYEFQDNELSENPVMILEDGVTMKFNFKDVLYYHKGNSELKLKYNTMTNYSIAVDEFEKIEEIWKYCMKGLIWYYEKETRLVIQLIGKAKKLINDNSKKQYKVVLDFNDDIKKRLKIDLAPEITDVNEVFTYKEIEDMLVNSSKVRFSTYKGEIKMKICEKCRYKIN